MTNARTARALRELYRSLQTIHGEQPWWPADSAFEVVVGAVLTQNAAWSNVEMAIDRMKAEGLMSLAAVLDSDHELLAETIRPSGYYNIKARRLRNLCEFLSAQGGLEAFADQGLQVQREGLLSVNGVGPETADDILLYALDRPVFVIDSYTRRLLQRMELVDGSEGYEDLRGLFEEALEADVYLYQQYHALIVIHAKELCRKVPRCGSCSLSPVCPAAG